MGKKYHHLTTQDREMIAVLKAEGKSFSKIGHLIGKDKSTVSREVYRNAPSQHKGYYLGHKAQDRAYERWQKSHQRLRLKDDETREYVEKHLKEGWSPELIAGRIKIDKPHLIISHESIYQYIYLERRELIIYLVRQHKKRKRRGYSRKHKKTHIPNRKPIGERPEVVTKRERIGDWEADTLVSRKSLAAINVLVDRKSRFTLLTKLLQKNAEETKEAIQKRLGIYPSEFRQTITYDNGSENTEHEAINQRLGTVSYFCQPYHSWEKGTVENTIGLVRRPLPKGTDLMVVSNEEIGEIESWLNQRPRKCLDYKKPIEVFIESFNEICNNRLSVALTG